MHKDVLFRGCTRPPMFMGVPYLPFLAGVGSCFLLALYFNLFFLVLAPPAVFLMRQMARHDELIFRLLGLRWRLKASAVNRQHHFGMWLFTPNHYRDNQRRRG